MLPADCASDGTPTLLVVHQGPGYGEQLILRPGPEHQCDGRTPARQVADRIDQPRMLERACHTLDLGKMFGGCDAVGYIHCDKQFQINRDRLFLRTDLCLREQDGGCRCGSQKRGGNFENIERPFVLLQYRRQ